MNENTTNDVMHCLFPTFVFASNLNREFTPIEKKVIEEEYLKTKSNIGNKISESVSVLEYKEMQDVKNFIEKKVGECFYKHLHFTEECQIYITQSWLNFTEINQYHHIHSHQNSFISGVFYFNADPEIDKIYFSKEMDIDQVLNIQRKENNLFQSDLWWLPCENGILYIFPSKLQHYVETKNHNNLRISLSFNTFVRGKIGTSGHDDLILP